MIEQRKPILFLRWLLFAAVLYLVASASSIFGWQGAVLMALAVTNVGLMVAPDAVWENRRLQPALFLFDTAVLSAILYFGGTASSDFFLAFFVVLAVVAMGGGKIRWAAVGGVAVVGVYGWMLYLEFGRDFITSPYLLGRLPFLFVVAALYGALAELARRLQHDAQLQRMLTGWVKKLSTTFADRRQAEELARHVLSEVKEVIPGTFRASLLRAGDEGLDVMFSSDDPQLKDLPLDPGRYPELKAAILAGEPLVLKDIQSDPRTARVRDKVRGLPFASLLICPIDIDEKGEEHVLFRVARARGGFSPKEVDVCHQLAAAVANLYKQAGMRERIERAERLQMMSQMASGVAHDFNNVLCSILMASQFLREEAAERMGPREDAPTSEPEERFPEEHFLEGFEQIEMAAKDGMTIVDRLASWSRLQRQDDNRRASDMIDPKELFEQAWRHAEPRWMKRRTARDLELHWKLEDTPPVQGNPTELREVLLNLVLNAIDAMPQGGTLTLGTQTRDGFVELSVQDTGTGIPPDLRDKIFEPLFTTKGSAGTGLGLSLARSVARQHGGSIELDSTEGAGSKFRLRLPMARAQGPRAVDATAAAPAADSVAAENGAAQEPAAALQESQDQGDIHRVLLLEDNAVVRDIANRFLEAAGYHTDAVGTAREAEVLLRVKRPYSCLVLDIHLPDASSVNLFDFLREHRPELLRRAVFYSAEDAPPELAQLQEEFDLPFVRKTQGLSALGEAVEQVSGRTGGSSGPDSHEVAANR